jgi:hypothetical protein
VKNSVEWVKHGLSGYSEKLKTENNRINGKKSMWFDRIVTGCPHCRLELEEDETHDKD